MPCLSHSHTLGGLGSCKCLNNILDFLLSLFFFLYVKNFHSFLTSLLSPLGQLMPVGTPESFTLMVLPAYYVGQAVQALSQNQQGLAERPKLISCMCSQLNSCLGRTNVPSCGTSLCKDLCMGWSQMVEIPTSFRHACSLRCSESLTQTHHTMFYISTSNNWLF